MDTIRLRTIEGRRMRDPKHPKLAVIATGAVFEVSINDVHWFRRLRDGDVEEVKRKAKVLKPFDDPSSEPPKKLAVGSVAEISALDPFWAAALARGHAELVPDESPPVAARPVSAASPVPAANTAEKAKE